MHALATRTARCPAAPGVRRRAPLLLSHLRLATVVLVAACAGPDAPGNAEPRASATGGEGTAVEAPGTTADPWERARRQGADFRAIGQEPGWVFEVYPQDSLRLLADYGEMEVVAPWTEPVRDEAGAATWTATADGHRLVVVVQDIPCTDVMSGDSFPQAVMVLLDERELHGCGRPLRE